jgi:predicted transcriptional regulator
MARKGRPTTSGARLDLDEPLRTDLADFLAAHDDASQRTVVHRAIRDYIENDLTRNQGVRERYEEIRRGRREEHAVNLHVVKPEKAG